jgi:hypothetical protein
VSFVRNHLKLLALAGSCAAIGAGAGVIANAGAATSSTAPSTTTNPAHRGGGFGARRLAARAVHGNLVVATKAGFANVTFDRGFVQSVSGQQLTLREGTKTQTYKTVTLTIPANARVRDDGKSSTLSAVKSGQRALVVQGPKRTVVIARTPASG